MFVPTVGAGGISGYFLVKETRDQQMTALTESADVAREVAYFKENIASVTSSEELLADRRLLQVALTAYGLEAEIDKQAFVGKVLDSDMNNDSSFANNLSDDRWRDFATAFSFNTAGGGLEMSSLELAVELAISDGERGGGLNFASFELEVFNAGIQTVQSAADPAQALIDNSTLLKVALESFGLNDQFKLDSFVYDILSSDLTDANSFANQYGDQEWIDFAEKFQQAAAPDATTTPFQDSINTAVLLDGLAEDFSPVDVSDEDLAAFRARIGDLDTAEKLVADEQVLNVVLTTFGLENSGRSTDFIVDILNDDVSDPNAFVNLLGDTRWKDLNEAFNGVTENGGRTEDFYRFEVEQRLEALGAPEEDLEYLRNNFNLIDENIDVVLDEGLKDVILSAFGLEKDTYSSDFVLSMIISDPNDPRSFVNVFNDDRWKEFVDVFGSVTNNGNTGLDSFQTETVDRYLERSFEISVGNVDNDIRVALNFERAIADIAADPLVAQTGWANVLADEALRTVIDASFNLPAEFINLDLDAQEATYIARAPDIFGGADPSVFLDPAMVDKAIQRYFLLSSLNTSNSSSNAALTMLSNAAAFGRTNGASAGGIVNTLA